MTSFSFFKQVLSVFLFLFSPFNNPIIIVINFQVKRNKYDLDLIRSQNVSAMSILREKVDRLEARLDNLQPTGEVANKLNLLTSQLNDLTRRVRITVCILLPH